MAVLLFGILPSLVGAQHPPNLSTNRLVAWCIVPFDASQRGPAERAEMLEGLGITRCAYDWRKQHVAEFEEEILEYKKRNIEMFAFWKGHEEAFALFEKHKIKPQIWHTVPSPKEGTQAEKIATAVETLRPLVERTKELGCKFGLYNHGGWGGKPANLKAVCIALREEGFGHVGIVYNWHHGHERIDQWEEDFLLMKPLLFCLNLNGMNTAAEPKILTLGQGEHDTAMFEVLRRHAYRGPVGILDHQFELDSERALRDSLAGLESLKSGKSRTLAKPAAEK